MSAAFELVWFKEIIIWGAELMLSHSVWRDSDDSEPLGDPESAHRRTNIFKVTCYGSRFLSDMNFILSFALKKGFLNSARLPVETQKKSYCTTQT